MTQPDNIEIVAELRDLVSRPAGRATNALHGLEQQLEDLDRDFRSGAISQDEYVRGLRRISRTSRLAGRDSVRLRRAIEKQVKVLGGPGGRRRGGLVSLLALTTKGIVGLGKSTTAFAKTFTLLKLPAMAAAFSVLVPVVTALGGAIFGLVGHFGPVVGLVATLPALGFAAATSLGIIATALAGVGEGLKTLRDPNLTPEEKDAFFADKVKEYKDFIVVLDQMVTPLKNIRDNVQATLLPELGRTVERMGNTYFPMLNREAGELAGTLGVVADRYANVFTSNQAQEDTQRIFDANNRMVERLGFSAINTGSFLRGMMVSAIPLGDRLSSAIERITGRLDRWGNSAEGRSAMEDFFDRAWIAAVQLWNIIRDLAVGLWNIASIGKGLGESMGGGLEQMVANFREWTESTSGQERIKQFFEDIRQTLVDLGELFGAIARGFMSLGTSADKQGDTQSFLDGITEAVPGIFRFIGVLITAAGWIGKMIGALGPLGTFLLTVSIFVGMLIRAFKPLWPIARFLFMRLLIPAVVALAGVLGWPITIALLLAAAFGTLYAKSETFRSAVKWLGDRFADVFGAMKGFVEDVILQVALLIDKIRDIDFPDPPDWMKGRFGGFNDNKDDWGWGRKDGGPVWPGTTFNVGEQGRELFVGASGKTSMLGEAGQHTKRFDEAGVVIPNQVTEAIVASSMAKAPPSSDGGGSHDPMGMPPVQVGPFYGAHPDEVREAVAAGIRQSRQVSETAYRRSRP